MSGREVTEKYAVQILKHVQSGSMIEVEVKMYATILSSKKSLTLQYNNKCRINETNYMLSASTICGVKIEHEMLNHVKFMKNLSRHGDLFEPLTPLLIVELWMEMFSWVGRSD
jgi:hypothetical protein